MWTTVVHACMWYARQKRGNCSSSHGQMCNCILVHTQEQFCQTFLTIIVILHSKLVNLSRVCTVYVHVLLYLKLVILALKLVMLPIHLVFLAFLKYSQWHLIKNLHVPLHTGLIHIQLATTVCTCIYIIYTCTCTYTQSIHSLLSPISIKHAH